MCGATQEQKTLETKQAAFYDEMTKQYTAVFGKQQGILDSLTAVFKPILDKGPSQRGFSDEQRTALNTQIAESTAHGYDDAKREMQEQFAARGGSDFIPSGGEMQTATNLAETAAETRASLENRTELADWEQGRQNWGAAASALEGVAAQENPVGFANATTGAGEADSKTANDIAAASNSIWGSVIGGLSGIAGQAVGGWTGGKKGKP